MKAIKLMLIAFCLGISTLAISQEKGDKLKQMIKNQDYNFIAQTALPQSGSSVYLTSEYDFKVTPTEIVSYLPFYGRAYTAPMNPNEGGIKFTSSNFKYTEKYNKKKGKWDITIVPNDYKEVSSVNISITESGYASLSVNSYQRSGISFSGYIAENKKKEKGGK
ncbi:DUF4251 domain-containing protein [Pseudopedobacter beijingensis]|uniref:DUF4251 domain-containing protein n=1 Tax=Pseudopedobacter beijingensis TaxID=1207056 RepID=A0ABW4IAH0_9SPHI